MGRPRLLSLRLGGVGKLLMRVRLGRVKGVLGRSRVTRRTVRRLHTTLWAIRKGRELMGRVRISWCSILR